MSRLRLPRLLLLNLVVEVGIVVTGGLVRLRLPLRRIAPQLVLLVEDDPVNQTVTEAMLRSLGYQDEQIEAKQVRSLRP